MARSGRDMDDLLVGDDEPSAYLTKPLTTEELLNEGGFNIQINMEEMEKRMKDEYFQTFNEDFDKDDLDNLNDPDCYNGAAFSTIIPEMEPIDKGGYVLKRILRHGTGPVVPENAIVYYDYSAYKEFAETPYDSTYFRGKPNSVRVGEGGVIFGLDIGLQTMRVNEKAQLIVKPEFAYGALGVLDRIPPNATLLFEVVLNRYVDSAAALDFDKLPEEKQKSFDEVFKHALALCERGNDMVKQYKNYKSATREYNIAVEKLEQVHMADMKEQEKQMQLLLRLYTNLVVSYNKIDNPRRCCINCNKIYSMCKNSKFDVPAKVYYNNAKALMALNDLKQAEQYLKRAAGVQRDSPEIVQCFLTLKRLQEEEAKLNKKMSEVFVGFEKHSISDDFKSDLDDVIGKLKENDNLVEAKFLNKLKPEELAVAKTEALKHGYIVEERKLNNCSDVEYFMKKQNQKS